MHCERRFWKGLCRSGWLPSDAPSECMAGQVSRSSLWAPRGLESPSRFSSTPRCGLGSLGSVFPWAEDEVGWMDLLPCSLDFQALGQRRAGGSGQGTGWPSLATAAQPSGSPASRACLVQTGFLLGGLSSLMTAGLSEALPGPPQEALLAPMSVQRPLPMVTSPAGPPVRGTDFISLLKRSQSEAQRPLDSDGPEQMTPRCPLPSDPPNLAHRVPLPAAVVSVENPNLMEVSLQAVKFTPLKGTIQWFSVSLLSWCTHHPGLDSAHHPRCSSLPLILHPPSSPDNR